MDFECVTFLSLLKTI